jgi:RimJ/RimL family protein N-acetyltransferase
MIHLPHSTRRLTLRLIREEDAAFMVELVQSDGWLRFIGERQIYGPGEAEAYIRNILVQPGQEYLIIEAKQTGQAAGILTLLKRDYLTYRDLGFALLPAYQKRGFALEACHALLEQLRSGEQQPLLAITLPDNERSISLLTKLGFHHTGEVEQQAESLSLYRLDP